jgi:hypothetical protein
MRKLRSSLFGPSIVIVAMALLLSSASTALASSSRVDKRAGSGRGVGLSSSRVVKTPLIKTKCASRRTSRLQPARHRCATKSSVASGTPQPLYWGATIGSQLTGSEAPWDMSAVTAFEQHTQKSASLVQFFQPFAECGSSCTMLGFPTTPMNDIRQHGSIPVLSWSSQSIPSTLNEPDFQLSDVIEGRYDSFITQFATEAREWAHPFFLRFNWEMNGNWFPWGEGANGNQPGQYVAAWRHVHDIFAAVGVSNVSWVWCPFVDPGSTLADVASLYPGDAYVDWTGLDGYNWGTNPASPRGWKTIGQLFDSTYEDITKRVAPSKPMMIAELGSSEYGGSKPAWIAEALHTIPTDLPDVRAVLWFDKFDDSMDWPIETSAGATTAFAEGISQSVYQGAAYAGIAGGAIPPPA